MELAFVAIDSNAKLVGGGQRNMPAAGLQRA